MTGKKKSRTYYVAKNGIIGIANKLIVIFLAFLGRTIFIKTLGTEYLGINGLYTNILTVLSLTELGIGNVLTFSLYKPLAENDEEKLSNLMFFYKKLYRWIAFVIFIIGICIIPGLRHIVKSTLASREVVLYYIIFLFNSAVSYLGVYKSTLIKADQKQYVVDSIFTISRFIVTIVQLVSLIVFRNFTMYLVIMVIGTILQNIILTMIVDKNYNISKSPQSLIEYEKKEIVRNVKSTFLYKFGQIIINYTDNILISIFVGTLYVGFYSNYSMITTQVQGFISILTAALIASIGNLVTENNKIRSYELFNQLTILFHIIAAFCSLCFLAVFNDFILLWLGKEFVLDIGVVFAITFSFYIQNIINQVWMYREAYGLFKEIKFLMLITALINIIFSVILGIKFGMAGIVIATGIARLLTTVWYEPKVLFKNIFNEDVRVYYLAQIKYCICTVISFLIVYYLTRELSVSIMSIGIKIILSFVVVISVFSILNSNNESFKTLLNKVLIIKNKVITKV